MRIEVTLAHECRRPVDVLVDLAIHFVKARGSTSRRVFKLRALHLAPGERATLGKRISLAQHTTRTHHSGPHAVELLLSGTVHPAGAFHLQPARRHPGS